MIHPRRVALLAVILAATAVGWLASGAAPASAAGGDPINFSDNQAFVQSVMSDIDSLPTYPGITADSGPYAGQTFTADDVEAGIANMDMAAGTLPGLDFLPWLAVGAAGLYTGLKLGTPLGQWIYTKITGGPSTSLPLPPKWNRWGPNSATQQCGGSFSSGSIMDATGTLGGAFAGGFSGTYPNCTGGSGAYYRNEYVLAAGSGTLFDAPGSSTSCQSTGYGSNPYDTYALSTWGGGGPAGFPGAKPVGNQGIDSMGTGCYSVVISQQAMQADLKISPGSNSTEWSAAPQHVTAGGWSAPSTAPDMASGIKACRAIPACDAYVDHAISVGGGDTTGTGTSSATTWVPIYLPQPLPGETYQDYFDRLAARNWLGAATVTDDPMGYPPGSPATRLTPGTITSISVGTSTVRLFDPATGNPASWPNPGSVPQITTATQPITVQKVPDGYAPSAPPNTLDFTPFTTGALTSTCRFPFGVLCYVASTVSAMNTAPVAPDLNWTIPDVNMGPLGTLHMGQHYDVNLGNTAMDTYMSWIRTIISWVLWLGAIWYVGSRLIGIRGGGDPTVAVDESFNGFTA
jgi:hypothetical protein